MSVWWSLITPFLCSLAAEAASGTADPRALCEHGGRAQSDAAAASIAVATAVRDAGSLCLPDWCAAEIDCWCHGIEAAVAHARLKCIFICC